MKRCFALILALSLVLCGCSGGKSAQLTTFCMNTVMDLQIWGNEEDAAMDQIRRELTQLERTWSATDEESLLCQLNQDPRIPLEPDQAALLDAVEQLSLRTGGAFDPKMRRLSEVWGFYDDVHQLPSQAQIDAALAHPQWDLGGALKGWAGQECAALLEQLDVDRALLNLGGNVQTYGQKSDGSSWNVGIQNPDGSDYLGILAVTGTSAIVTSGDYQRYFEVDGVRYHHILDPETGYPADSGLRSVTVVCRDGLTADCLSTALFVMGLEEGAEFWRKSNDFEAVFITDDGRIHATEGASLSGCEFEVICR